MRKGYELKGSIVPLVSPIARDERIDSNAICRLIAFHQKHGTDAVFLLGTCGEGPCLSDDAKERMIDATLEKAGNTPVLVGVAETGSRRAVSWAKKANRPGVAALVVMPPIFQFANSAGQHADHIKAVADAVGAPLVLYNLPSKTGNASVPIEAVQMLVEDGLIIGIKDSGGNLNYIAELLEIRKNIPSFRVMNGELKVACRALEMGVDGLVMSYTNIAPQECLGLIKAVRTGNIDRAKRLQEKFIAVWSEFPACAAPVAKVKAILSAKGLCEACCCAPTASLETVFNI